MTCLDDYLREAPELQVLPEEAEDPPPRSSKPVGRNFLAFRNSLMEKGKTMISLLASLEEDPETAILNIIRLRKPLKKPAQLSSS